MDKCKDEINEKGQNAKKDLSIKGLLWDKKDE